MSPDMSKPPAALPLPPEHLRILVGPFSDAALFARSGDAMMADIVSLCGLATDAKVLDVGCGCGRVARALAGYLGPAGRYHGFDPTGDLVAWCQRNLEPHLPTSGSRLPTSVRPIAIPAARSRHPTSAFRSTTRCSIWRSSPRCSPTCCPRRSNT